MTTLRTRLTRVALAAAAIVAVPFGESNASASDGDWRWALPLSQAFPPGTYAPFTPSLFCSEGSPTPCAWTPTMTITATAIDGAQFYSNPGDVQTIDYGGVPIATCSTPTATTFSCTFTGSGTVGPGEELASAFGNPVMFGIPATAAPGSTPITINWSDSPMDNNTDTNDTYSHTVSDEAAVPIVQPVAAAGALGALAIGGLVIRKRRRQLVVA